MSTFRSFEELEVWQAARRLVSEIYQEAGKGRMSKDYALSDQLRRAGISIMANIAEGFERDGMAEFIQFLSIAKGSSGEIKAHLYIALDQGYMDRPRFEQLRDMSDDISRQISGFMSYLRKSPIKGAKYK